VLLNNYKVRSDMRAISSLFQLEKMSRNSKCIKRHRKRRFVKKAATAASGRPRCYCTLPASVVRHHFLESEGVFVFYGVCARRLVPLFFFVRSTSRANYNKTHTSKKNSKTMGTKKKDVPPEETQRIIVVGRPDYERCDNKISTSKYNVFTFLPIVRTFVPFFFSLTSCCIAALVFFKKRYFRQIQAMDPCSINTCCCCCVCVCKGE
jgi:hypothetical protein